MLYYLCLNFTCNYFQLLLYGSPGTGKTSFIHALAGELGLNIYVVNLSSKNLTDDTLSELVSDTPSRCLLLIEDVDAAFVQRASKDAAQGITFSGLLNSVDGVSAQEGRMLCMTTKYALPPSPFICAAKEKERFQYRAFSFYVYLSLYRGAHIWSLASFFFRTSYYFLAIWTAWMRH